MHLIGRRAMESTHSTKNNKSTKLNVINTKHIVIKCRPVGVALDRVRTTCGVRVSVVGVMVQLPSLQHSSTPWLPRVNTHILRCIQPTTPDLLQHQLRQSVLIFLKSTTSSYSAGLTNGGLHVGGGEVFTNLVHIVEVLSLACGRVRV